jgi:UDP-N-acetylmuramate--alanine ligase
VFQPHRYSRTQSLWREFADAFVGADELILTDVYAAAEAPRAGVTGKLIVDAVSAAHPDQAITYVAERAALAGHLAAQLQSGDLCLTIGAGDITGLSSEIMDVLDGSGSAR